jgi:hypothetical protein
MNAVTARGRHPDIRTEAREMIKRQMQEWFDLCDRILDIHRSNFVFREPTTRELEEHKIGLKDCIQFSRAIAAQVVDPSFADPDLVSRLHVRIQQLEDAYNTFHNPKLSDEEAERISRQVFPE